MKMNRNVVMRKYVIFDLKSSLSRYCIRLQRNKGNIMMKVPLTDRFHVLTYNRSIDVEKMKPKRIALESFLNISVPRRYEKRNIRVPMRKE